MVASYVGENKLLESQYLTGKLELELIPQGTMAEKCAAGAAGVPAFYTPAAYGTIGKHSILTSTYTHALFSEGAPSIETNQPRYSAVQTGELPTLYNSDKSVAVMSKPRETRKFNGKNYVMEESLFGDVALVRVNKADRLGNCTFRKAQNNFNEAMGKNARLTIAEADEIVEVGEIPPENVHLSGIYVDKVILSTEPKQIEKITFAKSAQEVVKSGKYSAYHQIPRRRPISYKSFTSSLDEISRPRYVSGDGYPNVYFC